MPAFAASTRREVALRRDETVPRSCRPHITFWNASRSFSDRSPWRLPRRSNMSCDDIFAHGPLEDFRYRDRTVRTLIILDKLAKDAWQCERGIVERMDIAHGATVVAVADVEPTRLEVMEIRGGVRFAISF